MSDQLEYNDSEVEALKQWLSEMADADGYEHAEFDVTDGITVDCDWSINYDEPTLPVSVLVHGEGFELFTRSAGDTLTETGEYGFGPNHGDTLAADIEGWFQHHFTDGIHDNDLVFEFNENWHGDPWLFTAWAYNPNYENGE